LQVSYWIIFAHFHIAWITHGKGGHIWLFVVWHRTGFLGTSAIYAHLRQKARLVSNHNIHIKTQQNTVQFTENAAIAFHMRAKPGNEKQYTEPIPQEELSNISKQDQPISQLSDLSLLRRRRNVEKELARFYYSLACVDPVSLCACCRPRSDSAPST
jgi:hypothetical protein